MELIVTMRQDVGLATVTQNIIHRFDGWLSKDNMEFCSRNTLTTQHLGQINPLTALFK